MTLNSGGAAVDERATGRVAVVGAGPAGLAAAMTLAERGLDVVLYERAARAGGMLRTETMDGARVDVGVQLVGSPHIALFDLAARAGAESILQRSPGHDALWRKGRAHGITYGSVSSMVASGALPTTLKLKLAGRYLPFLKSDARQLDVSDLPGSGAAAFDAESIAAWGRRQLGDEFVELLVYPLLAAYYGADPEETAAGVYHALALVGLEVSVYGAVSGFGALADAITSWLDEHGAELRCGVEVASVRAADGMTYVDDDGFDAVVLAVPANTAARLLGVRGQERAAAAPGLPAALGDFLGAVRERSALTLACRLDRPFPGDYFGLSFPRTSEHGARIAALCIQGRKLGGLVPAGGDAVVVLPAPRALPALLAQTDEQVVSVLMGDLDAAVPGLSRRVTEARVFRFDDAYTVFEPGHVRRLVGFDESWLPPTVALAGDYMLSPSVEGAVRSGIRAARRILAAGSAG